jgi:hypothetical protein
MTPMRRTSAKACGSRGKRFRPPRRMVSVPPGTSIVSRAKTAEVYVVEVMVEL